MFDFLKTNAFGLDIFDSSVRIVQLKKKRRGFKLVSWGETEIPAGLIEDEKKFIELLKRCLKNIKGKKIKTKNAIVSLPEKNAFLATIQLPTMKEEELRSAITFQAENYIPFSLNEVYLDFQVLPSVPKQKDGLNVLLVAFPKKIIDQCLSVLKKAGILPVVFETESQAITRVLAKNNTQNNPFFMINFGQTNTIFAIYSECIPHFSSSISVCSQDLTKAISESLKISLEEAEKLKLKHGLGSRKKGEEIFKAIEPVLNNLAEQIKKYISYYQTYGCPEGPDSNKREKIEKIILCGKGASLNGLSDFLSSKLGMSIKLAMPWQNISKGSKLSSKESLGFVTALGLALRGTEE